MNDQAAIDSHITRIGAALGGLRSPKVVGAIGMAVETLATALLAGGKVLVAGNGGSAAEAQHLAGEFLGRLDPAGERGPLPAVALTGDSGVVTALANDYGYEQVFARQVAGLGRAGDVLVVLSTSGASPNLIEAVGAAHRLDLSTVALLGASPSPLSELCGTVVEVPSVDVQVVQECHLVLIHLLVELLEARLGLR